MWLVIFPEGTRYNPELVNIIEGSKRFAENQGLQPLECVLFPRMGALEVCVQQLRESIQCIYDVTIAYESAFHFKGKQRLPAPSMQDFLMGWCPRVHIHIARIPMTDVPSDPEQLKLWLYSRFQVKDRLLQEFYSATRQEEARFPGMHVVRPLALSVLLPSVLLWSGTVALCNSSALYRNIYWKVGLGAAVAGLVWSGLRY
ncbi:unnamed protein product [Candidula unifasciata]|uniref:Acyltransferase C-terminal domain-containing protein n=1 Tax=Candidula unifasciata TaxID=100452 RepID=A0A8S3Z1I9_9EUPU|nr:unnamed protein product [Candidula unifasciata]